MNVTVIGTGSLARAVATRALAGRGLVDLTNPIDLSVIEPLKAAFKASFSAGPKPAAMSITGPSGGGVLSGSHPPTSTRTSAPANAQQRRTVAVLPIPASPRSSTNRPEPTPACSRWSARSWSTPSRSSSSTRVSVLCSGSQCDYRDQRLPDRPIPSSVVSGPAAHPRTVPAGNRSTNRLVGAVVPT